MNCLSVAEFLEAACFKPPASSQTALSKKKKKKKKPFVLRAFVCRLKSSPTSCMSNTGEHKTNTLKAD